MCQHLIGEKETNRMWDFQKKLFLDKFWMEFKHFHRHISSC